MSHRRWFLDHLYPPLHLAKLEWFPRSNFPHDGRSNDFTFTVTEKTQIFPYHPHLLPFFWA
jgi:hypothetical protein